MGVLAFFLGEDLDLEVSSAAVEVVWASYERDKGRVYVSRRAFVRGMKVEGTSGRQGFKHKRLT